MIHRDAGTANRPNGPFESETIKIGKTFEDALVLLKEAHWVAVAVPHIGAEGDWSFVSIAKKDAERWLSNAVLSGFGNKPADPLFSRLRKTSGGVMIRAFCFADGAIGFGRSIPKGAVVFARGPAEALRDYITAKARHGYQSRQRRGRKEVVPGSQVLLVPGIPESDSQIEKAQRFAAWCKLIAIQPPAGVRVLPV